MTQPKPLRLSVPISSALVREAGYRHLLDVARMAEDSGVDDLTMGEHVVLSPKGHQAGPMAGAYPSDTPWLEPLTTFAALAAVTTRIRFLTMILIAPLRPAGLLAKTAATVDQLSEGRLVLGVSTSWHREEYEMLGADFANRGQVMEDMIGACQALWREMPADYESPTLSFRDIACNPGPYRSEGIPVWFGSHLSPRTVRRVAKLGSGWSANGETPERVKEGVAQIKAAMAANGRDPSILEVPGPLPQLDAQGQRVAPRSGVKPDLAKTLEQIPALREFGYTSFNFGLAQWVGSVGEAEPFLKELGQRFGAYRTP
jgi:probable F420-dependent oxidoreductase